MSSGWVVQRRAIACLNLNLRSQPWNLVPYNPGGQLNPYVWRNTIHRDSTGVVWVGTTNGLQGINPVSDQVFTYQSDPNRYKGLASSSAQAVYHDRSGMLWVGTDNGIDRQAREHQTLYHLPGKAQ
jgi:ligand-binding sensor domain-containing protein